MAASLVQCASGMMCRRFIKQGCRTLFSGKALKTEQFAQVRAQKEAISKKVDVNFRDRMRFNLKSSNTKVIFSDELVKMIYLVRKNDADDMELFVNMLKNMCNQETKPTNTVLGNIIMCMFYWLDEPELALQVLRNPEFECIFMKSNSYLVLMDLLFEKKEYEKVLDVFRLCQQRGRKCPFDCSLITLAACYKLNTKESFDFAKELIDTAKECKLDMLRRTLTFACALAIKQNEPEYALEILSFIEEDRYFTVSNLKMMALSDLDNLDEVFQLLNAILGHNSPEIRYVRVYKQLYPDTFIKIKAAVQRAGCRDRLTDLMTIKHKLSIQKKICGHNLDDELLKEVTRKAEEPTVLRSREIYKTKDLFEDDAKLMKIRKGLLFADE